jgi:uncharacterized coiled-coil DUF342 family protein
MKIKHKLLSDYQYVSPDKKIFLIKSGTIIEEFKYKLKGDTIPLDKEVIEMNPQIFEIIDWKAELLSFMRSEKMPQPAQLGKKLIPFIEDMILSSIPQNSGPTMDESKVKEIEWKETDLNNRERRIKDKEEEIDIRLKRVEKRESEHKEELKSLDKKEDELRTRSRDLTEKQLDLEDKLQDLKEKERNFDRSLLESSKDLDSKYAELQSKIDTDLKLVSDKEKELENLSKELKRKEDKLTQQEDEINDKVRDFNTQKEELNLFAEEIKNLNKEIQDWENMHWKFKRNIKPPSCIED